MLEVFRVSFSELTRAYVEAHDNVRFLGTLERHFKTLAGGGSLAVVTESLPSLLNGLRLVWLISRHYNTDETMTLLLKRVVNELVERTTSEVRRGRMGGVLLTELLRVKRAVKCY